MKKVFILAIIIIFLTSACSWQKESNPKNVLNNTEPKEQAESTYSSFEDNINLKVDDNFEIVKIIQYTGSLGNEYSAYRWKWENDDLYVKFIQTINVCETIEKIEENLDNNNINLKISQSNNQKASGNYCNGIAQYLIEFKLNNIEKKDYNLIDTIGEGSRSIKANIESNYNERDYKNINENNTNGSDSSLIEGTEDPVIIYKTKAEYYNLVPVFLSEDKNKITFYPSREDLYKDDFLSYPNKMSKDYIYDNFGINENIAFLDISYDDYSQSSQELSREVLYEKIIDKDPILEMYDCKNLDIANNIVELNKLIKRNELSQCEKIK